MNKIVAVLKIFANILFFMLYSLFGIIVGNFLFGLYMVKIAELPVPNAYDSVHYTVAGISLMVVFIFTFLLKKYLYIEVFSEKFLEDEYNKKNEYTKKKKDDLEIYVNKEL